MTLRKAMEILLHYLACGEYTNEQDFKHAVLLASIVLKAAISLEVTAGRGQT